MKKKFLALSDLKGMTEKQVIEHLVNNYSGTESGFNYGEIAEADKKEARKLLKGLRVLIAYESVGDYGCDSSGWFLLANKEGELFTVNGSHCSCYGFEGQLQLESTTKKTLLSFKSIVNTGGYETDEGNVQKQVRHFIENL